MTQSSGNASEKRRLATELTAAQKGFSDLQSRISNMKSISAMTARSAAQQRATAEQQLAANQQALVSLEVGLSILSWQPRTIP